MPVVTNTTAADILNAGTEDERKMNGLCCKNKLFTNKSEYQ